MKKFKTALCSFLLVVCFSANIFGDGLPAEGDILTDPGAAESSGVIGEIGETLEETGEDVLDFLYNLLGLCPPRQCGVCPEDAPNCRP